MKTILTLCSCLLTAGLLAQPRISQRTLQDVQTIQKHASAILKGDGELLEAYPVNRFQGAYYVSFLGRKQEGAVLSNPENQAYFFGETSGNIVSVRVRLDELQLITSLQGLSYLELAGKIKPTLDRVVYDTRVDSVHAGFNLPHGYTGKNVIIGVTDWGFDYSSPMFYDTLLTETRIIAAWDQFKTSGPAPSGYAYGTEYTTPSELIAAGADTANIYSYATHGTHVSGIAGGSGAGLQYRGIGFESQFLFTTFLVDEAAVLDAWQWMQNRAQALGKRLVVNMSWGLYHFGTNDGNSLLSQAIADFSDEGVVFVTSGGNNGNVNFHIKKEFNSDTLRTKVDFYSYSANANMWGQSLHMWGENGHDFEARISVQNVPGTLLAECDFYPTTLNGYVDSFMVAGTDTIWYNLAAESSHPLNSRPTMRLRVKNTNTSLRVVLHARATDGLVHFWNVTELSNDVGNWGMPFTSLGTGFTSGDNLYGIGEPAAADDVITVAAHSSTYLNTSGNEVGGPRASFSSIGPRYDEVRKPDVSAPGVSVMSSISSYTDNQFTQQAVVSFNGRDYPFARFSGTSMSSPATAGVCALVLEANPFLTSEQVKEIILTTTREDIHTGDLPPNGDNYWGMGKVNAYAAVKLALNTIGLSVEEIPEHANWSVYPNPASATLYLKGLSTPEKVQFIGMNGTVYEPGLNSDGSISVQNMTAGTYVLRVVTDGHVYQKKVVLLP